MPNAVRTLLTVLALAAGASSLLSGQDTLLSFDAASIKPNRSGPDHVHINQIGDLLSMSNITLKSCIVMAYGVKDYQVVAPVWLDSERYDIVAKAAGDAAHDQSMARLQTLLAERFRVALHRETREHPVYELVVAKSGLKMKREPAAAPGDSHISSHNNPYHIVFQAASMAQLAGFLERPKGGLDRPVVDKTGLDGAYSFTLDWTPEDNADPSNPRPAAKKGADEWPPLLVALQEQLGLKLEARKGPIQVIVIDHAEKVPTEN